MKKFEVISPFLDFDDQTIEIGAVIELDDNREAVLKKACVIGEHPIKDESKKKTTKRSE